MGSPVRGGSLDAGARREEEKRQREGFIMTIGKAAPRIKAAERVAAELRREIITGNLRPGDRLASEKELQEQFEISRPTLREALRLLEAESLIEVVRGQYGGARVTKLST